MLTPGTLHHEVPGPPRLTLRRGGVKRGPPLPAPPAAFPHAPFVLSCLNSSASRGPRRCDLVQLAVPIPRDVSRWFRHYALDQGLSMAALIRRILRDFMAAHGGPVE